MMKPLINLLYHFVRLAVTANKNHGLLIVFFFHCTALNIEGLNEYPQIEKQPVPTITLDAASKESTATLHTRNFISVPLEKDSNLLSVRDNLEDDDSFSVRTPLLSSVPLTWNDLSSSQKSLLYSKNGHDLNAQIVSLLNLINQTLMKPENGLARKFTCSNTPLLSLINSNTYLNEENKFSTSKITENDSNMLNIRELTKQVTSLPRRPNPQLLEAFKKLPCRYQAKQVTNKALEHIDSPSCKTACCLLIPSCHAGTFIGTERNFIQLEAFLSPSFKQTQFFGDVSLYRLTNSHFAKSFGIGVREWAKEKCCAIGFNCFYDQRPTSGGAFQQLGLGFEAFRDCFCFRMNGYVPIGKNCIITSSTVFDDYIGDFMATCRVKEFSYKGLDLSLTTKFVDCPKFSEFLTIGGYIYHRPDEDIIGGFASLDFKFSNCIDFTITASHNNVFGTNLESIISMTIPLNKLCSKKCRKNCKKRCYCEPVYRRGLIFTNCCCDWTWNW